MKPRELVIYFFLFLNLILLTSVVSIKLFYNDDIYDIYDNYDKEYNFILFFSTLFLVLGFIPYFRNLVFEP